MASQHKTSEELEREIEARRARIEDRVDDISARLSPGQLLDEALRYTRNGPGAEFSRNLGRSVMNNPLPVALAAASLGWLAIQSNLPRHEQDNGYRPNAMYDRHSGDDEDYPVAMIAGTSIKRVGTSDQNGDRFSEFADSSGRKFKALSDEAGSRAGHFADESGRMFRGFIDESGHIISDFRDEAGNRLHHASGWAAHNWRKAGEGASRFGRSARDSAGQLGDQMHRAGHGLQKQGQHVAYAADDFVHQQPLVSGAIAFAIGAIIGGALPSTRQEDEAFGSTADSVKHGAARQAENLYDRGRDDVGQVHDEARRTVADAYGESKEAVHR